MENPCARLRNHQKHSQMRNSPVTTGRPETRSQPEEGMAQEDSHIVYYLSDYRRRGKTYDFCTHWRGYIESPCEPLSHFILQKANSSERVV